MVNTLETITGSADFVARRDSLRSRVLSQLPPDCLIPPSALDGLDLDVTSMPASCGILSEDELAITELGASEVRDRIASGRLTAVAAVTAFGRRAAIAHQVVHCLVDFFLDEGIARAKELDDYYEKTGKVVGPLHGVPISIKDHMSMKGHWSSNGFQSGVHITTEDATLVALLRSLGAVFYVKTNQPQTIMHLETHSCYGRTLNPHNTALTAGGSSGGEAALVAMKGSCLGLGTDGGGSIRNPAGNCGVYGFRPTIKTMPVGGYLFYMEGADGFYTSTGPICATRRDIDMFMSAVRSSQPHLTDPSLYPQPWINPGKPERKLRVGVMRHDGVVVPQPPMLRGFDYAVNKLRSSDSVEVVDFAPLRARAGYDILRSLFFEDGGKDLSAQLAAGGEEPLELTKWLLDPRFTKEHSLLDSWAARDAKVKYQQAYADHWREADLDVLLCPPFPGTACRHDTARYWGYTALYNLLDYPGIVFPTGLKSDAAVDIKTARDDFIPDPENSDEYNHQIYDSDTYHGAPISLQLLAYRFDDCKLYAALEVVEDIIKG